MRRAKVEAQAWRDIIAIAEFLADVAKNSAAGVRLLGEFHRKCETYARQPTMGDHRADLGEGLRSFTFRRWYVAIYQPHQDGIRVLRVFDGRRDLDRCSTIRRTWPQVASVGAEASTTIGCFGR
jgi:plasmid stabilization system protein ParE